MDFGMHREYRVSLRGPKGAVAISGHRWTGNFSRTLLPRDCHVASLLAMTGEIEARAQTIIYICHCQAPKGPWQSLGSNGREIAGERDFPEIAASASPPRNDRGNRSPGTDHQLHLSLRGPEGAVAIRAPLQALPLWNQLPRVRIATSASPPRNDSRWSDCITPRPGCTVLWCRCRGRSRRGPGTEPAPRPPRRGSPW